MRLKESSQEQSDLDGDLNETVNLFNLIFFLNKGNKENVVIFAFQSS